MFREIINILYLNATTMLGSPESVAQNMQMKLTIMYGTKEVQPTSQNSSDTMLSVPVQVQFMYC